MKHSARLQYLQCVRYCSLAPSHRFEVYHFLIQYKVILHSTQQYKDKTHMEPQTHKNVVCCLSLVYISKNIDLVMRLNTSFSLFTWYSMWDSRVENWSWTVSSGHWIFSGGVVMDNQFVQELGNPVAVPTLTGHRGSFYTPRTTKLLGGILVSLRPSVRPSVFTRAHALATICVHWTPIGYILSIGYTQQSSVLNMFILVT